MKYPATLFLIVVLCVVLDLGFMELCGILRPTTPVAVAASDVRVIDELIGKQVLIRFITGAGGSQGHEKVRGVIAWRGGEFLVVRERRSEKLVWCNLRNISTIWPEEDK